MTQLYDILISATDNALENVNEDGTFPAGMNGPWGDSQTPVRNTGHWLITLLHCYNETGEDRYRRTACRALDYLTSEEARPYEKTIYHLAEHKQSRCNGLVGQAWSIEALVQAAQTFDRSDCLQLAKEIFHFHPFDETLAAWDYVDIDGNFTSLDKTFNHQLWFAAAGGLLSKYLREDNLIHQRVQRFLEELPRNINQYDSGLIYHPFKPEFNFFKYTKIFSEGVRAGNAHKMIFNLVQSKIGGENGDPMKEVSVGYHSFNMYAFAILKSLYPNHSFWNHEKFENALSFSRTTEFKQNLNNNPYGYPYNCAGIEMAYVLETFCENVREEQRWWLENQFSRTFDFSTMTMSKNNPDSATLTARLYEATRLPDITISIDCDTVTK